MAKKSQQEFVQHITPRDVDFSQWYTDVVRLADLMAPKCRSRRA